jgi:hypothetical protein
MCLRSCVWNAGPNAHDIESVLMQTGNIWKGITEGFTKFQTTQELPQNSRSLKSYMKLVP